MIEEPKPRRTQRRMVHAEADAIDRILFILDELASWRSTRRVLFFVLITRWERLSKTIVVADLEA